MIYFVFRREPINWVFISFSYFVAWWEQIGIGLSRGILFRLKCLAPYLFILPTVVPHRCTGWPTCATTGTIRLAISLISILFLDRNYTWGKVHEKFFAIANHSTRFLLFCVEIWYPHIYITGFINSKANAESIIKSQIWNYKYFNIL